MSVTGYINKRDDRLHQNSWENLEFVGHDWISVLGKSISKCEVEKNVLQKDVLGIIFGP